jgi:hypothetical protein
MRWIALAVVCSTVLAVPATGTDTLQGRSPDPVVVKYGYSGPAGSTVAFTWEAPGLSETLREAVRTDAYELQWVTGVTMDETSLRLSLAQGRKSAEVLDAVKSILEKHLAPETGIMLRQAGIYYKGGPRKRR